MTPDGIQRAFSALKYERDQRRPSDERRRGRFFAGWEDATRRGKVYSPQTLKRLTWHNLGYRLGTHFGEQTSEQIGEAFEIVTALCGPPNIDNAPVLKDVPSPEKYAAAFRESGSITDSQLRMFRAHYHAPARTVTAKQLAAAVGWSSYSIANSQYGRLARLIAEQLGYSPEPERLGTLVLFDQRQGEWHWLMRDEVAQALEMLGWVEGASLMLPEEIAAPAAIVEGAVCRVLVNAYERSPEARRRCIEHHGVCCCICGFNFGDVYGKPAEGYTHVHHLRPLSDIREKYVVDPVEDLRPVCPNCHAVIHQRIPSYNVEEVRAFLRGSQRRHC
jgi:putative restriction endonuclease